MIDLNGIRTAVVTKLTEYLGTSVIRANTTGKLPNYPFASYTIRQLISNHKGTWGEYNDGKDRIPAQQIWSISIQSDDCAECMDLAIKAHDFFSKVGIQDLKDNGIVVQTVDDIINRDTILTVDYEFKNGFDVTLSFMNVTDGKAATVGYIDTVEIENIDINEEV